MLALLTIFQRIILEFTNYFINIISVRPIPPMPVCLLYDTYSREQFQFVILLHKTANSRTPTWTTVASLDFAPKLGSCTVVMLKLGFSSWSLERLKVGLWSIVHHSLTCFQFFCCKGSFDVILKEATQPTRAGVAGWEKRMELVGKNWFVCLFEWTR